MSRIVGRWRITSIINWDKDFIDAEVPAYISFAKDAIGEFRFGDVRCDIAWQQTARDEEPAVEFTFKGMDEMDPSSGRG